MTPKEDRQPMTTREDEPPANELRDEPEKFRRVYLSPPPAAGWDEVDWRTMDSAPKDGRYVLAGRFRDDELKWVKHSRWMSAEEACEEEGGASADDYDAGWTDGEDEHDYCYPTHWMPLKALRREAPAPKGVSTPSAAAESNASVEAIITEIDTYSHVHGVLEDSDRERMAKLKDRVAALARRGNASVEARLREALAAVTTDLISIADKDEDPLEWASVKQAYGVLGISAVGDEAKKSEGAIYAEVSKRETPPEERAEIERVIDKALQDQAVCEALERRPSSPTAERREIVVQIVREAMLAEPFRIENFSERATRRCEIAGNAADAILAALDGGK